MTENKNARMPIGRRKLLDVHLFLLYRKLEMKIETNIISSRTNKYKLQKLHNKKLKIFPIKKVKAYTLQRKEIKFT